ncbi:MAG TPA: type II secretion system protein N, partial [Rheinheimera sp.]|nr:type II secretion system protein N [Rheinheimera sp.]
MKPLLDTQQLVHYLQKIPQRRVQQLLNLVLVVVLAWLLAQLSWKVMPTPTQAEFSPAELGMADAGGNDTAVSLNALTAFSLFGKADAAPVKKVEPIVTEAPKTQLNVKLTGLVAVSAEPGKGSAIIESRGSEATYAVNDTIEGTSAVLKQVLADRVLLQQGGRYETLMLDGFEYTKIAQANAGLGRIDEQQIDDASADMAPVVEPMEMQPLQVSDELEQRREELIA